MWLSKRKKPPQNPADGPRRKAAVRGAYGSHAEEARAQAERPAGAFCHGDTPGT